MSPAPLSPAQLLRKVFIEATTSDLADIARALEQGNRAEALHHAHRIHGAALSMGASAVASAAGALESALRGGPVGTSHCQPQLAQLAVLMQQWVQAQPAP